GILPRLEESLNIKEGFPDSDVQQDSSQNPDLRGPRFTHFYLGSVDTRPKQVDTSPRFQKTQLPDWDNRSTLDQSKLTLVFLESSCSRVFGVVVLLCELYSRF
ncbi:hypothetical protein Taro_000353, partial [Colocasia esculenta]|nr:hypothetical protein [Colocasia esculenta]